MQNYLSLTAIALLASGCAAKSTPSEPVPAVVAEIDEAVEVPAEEPTAVSSTTLADAVAWMPANPDREDGPHMALVSGNPQEGAFTFMVKFPAGHGDPVHSHPSDFTGILTSGELSHGRSAEDFDLVSQGGALVQPANEAHYTGCSDAGDCVLVGHMSGVMATVPSDAPVEGEMAYSVTDAEGIGYEALNPKQPQGPKMAVLSGDRMAGAFQALVHLPAGSSGPMHSHSSTYSAVLLSGTVNNGNDIPVGSHWTHVGGDAHTTSCVSEEPCVFFAAMDGAFDMVPVAAAPVEE